MMDRLLRLCASGQLRAEWCRHDLLFLSPAVTSRQVMTTKESYFLRLTDQDSQRSAIGECAIFRGLSEEDTPDYADRLDSLCRDISGGIMPEELSSSLRFGLETAAMDLDNGGSGMVYDTPWARGTGSIAINGLIWMGSEQEMAERIAHKLDAGFRCLKLKIGGIDFESEIGLLRAIRKRFPSGTLELRLDANGAFSPDNVMVRLERLSGFTIHSIEQPVKAGQWDLMARVCRTSPIPVALDEELIGLSDDARKGEMLDAIKPQYVIIKPSLCGGLTESRRWIDAASTRGIGWWITSALESNVGLNAVAQLASTYRLSMPQGLGTGALYSNNVVSPLRLTGDGLTYDPDAAWDYSILPL